MSKAYCGISKIPKGSKRGSMKDCAMSGQVRYYGIKKIDPKIVAYAKDAKKGFTKRNTLIENRSRIKGKINAITKKHKAERNPEKRKKLNEEYKKLAKELNAINAKLRKMNQSRLGSRKSSRKRSRKRSKKRSSKGSKKRSRKGSKKRSHKGSKKRSRKSRKRSRKN